MLEKNFWQNKSKSQKVIKEKKFQEEIINSYNFSVKQCTEITDLYNLALEENNISIINETLKSLEELKLKTKKNEIKCFLSSDTDSMNSYVEIHACAGGTESQDWAEMLRRMYLKWFDKKNFKYQMISEHRGE